MSSWPSIKAKRLLNALLAIGWQVQRQTGSHRTLLREGSPEYAFRLSIALALTRPPRIRYF